MVEKFREQDQISIVGFSSEAQVVLPAHKKNSIEEITKAVNQIVANGSTNLNAGLMLGYQQAMEQFDIECTNRVILLTDGLANTGTTDPDQIAKESKKYNKEGVSLSTIGLGYDLNQELLRQLADTGRGLIHFIDDSKDITKVFIREVDSLLSPAANKVKLTLDFGDCKKVPKIYGYDSKISKKGNRLTFKIDDLNHNATQVIMSKIKPSHEISNIVATLEYRDAITKQRTKTVQKLDITTKKVKESPQQTHDLLKNYTIAQLSQSIQKSIEKTENKKPASGVATLKKSIKKTRKSFKEKQDQDVDRVVKIATELQEKIESSILHEKREKAFPGLRKDQRCYFSQ
ncbi:MAG: VWA domain-containing protein [Pirellulaceae bacterium]|nr:VWA domain-containing protein [Pirellulaceae bacterium]